MAGYYVFSFFLIFYIWILCKKKSLTQPPPPSSQSTPPLPQQKKSKNIFFLFFLDFDSLKNKFTNISQSSLTFTPLKRKHFFQTLILLKKRKKSLTLATPHPLPSQPLDLAQSVGHLTRKSGVLGSIPGLATFRFSFRFFKKGSCQLLAKVCARSTG